MAMYTPNVDAVARALEPKVLIDALRAEFRANCLAAQPGVVAPLRAHHVIESPTGDSNQDTHLLMMPAWEPEGFIGIKLVGVNASNPGRQNNPQPMVQGIYLLLDAKTGAPVAQFDAQELTFRRTTAVSGLGADYLAGKDATRLGVLGGGAAMAPYLVETYRAIRDIREVWLWNRTGAKQERLARELAQSGLRVHIAKSPDEVVEAVDIVTSCTPSDTPLIRGDLLRPGMHVDCLGGFRPTMREADDQVVKRARVFGDTIEGVTKEAGDIMIPLAAGVLSAGEIEGDLFALCAGTVPGRQSHDEITFFKSVGSALSDLAGAKLVYSSRDG